MELYSLTSQSNESRILSCLERMVSFDTQNPPGYELEAAKFLSMELAAIGFETSLSEFNPGKENIVATHEGSETAPRGFQGDAISYTSDRSEQLTP